MTWKTSLAVMTAGLLLAGTADAQTPGGTTKPGMPRRTTPGIPGSTMPRTPGSTIPGTPGSITPATPGSTTPGAPGSPTPGLPDGTTAGAPDPSGPGLNPTFPCPPGQARRPGSTICSHVIGPTIPNR